MKHNTQSAQLIAYKHALELEICGYAPKGASAYSKLKRVYRLVGNKRQVYAQVCDLLDEVVIQPEMLHPNPAIRRAIEECVETVQKALHTGGDAESYRTVREFEILFVAALGTGKSLLESFDTALSVMKLDETLSYRDGTTARDFLVPHNHTEKEDDD